MDKQTIIVILIIAGIISLSVAYYFTIALPKHNSQLEDINRESLLFEQQKYQDEIIEKENIINQKEIIDKANDTALIECINKAVTTRNEYMINNGGTRTEDGLIKAKQTVIERAVELEESMKNQCYKLYN